MSNPVNILETIDNHVQMLKLIRRLPIGTKLFRGRMHQEKNKLKQVADFGPPPIELAKSNRMSAEGISLFYAALEQETALKEIYDEMEYATVAKFKTNRNLTILDLTKLQSMAYPSIFDEENRQKRNSLLFLKEFAKDICKKINGVPSIEYVPTQIVTEYFRYVFKSKYGNIDGILYNSSQNNGGHCIVLFMSNEDFISDQKCMVNKSTMKLEQFKNNFEAIKAI